MHISTLQSPPPYSQIVEEFGFIMSSCPVEISDKGIVRNLLERKRNGYKEALDLFKSYIPAEANAVLGLQVSTAVQSFDNETFIYITFAGTPVILEFDEE